MLCLFCFITDSLIGCDSNHLYNVVDRTSSGEVVDRSAHSLKYRADRFGIAKALN